MRWAVLAWALTVGLGGTAPRGEAAGEAPPTAAQRVEYWLDRLLKGPEPTTWGMPNFHQDLWGDAIRNLIALGPTTLDRLSDPALRERVQGSPDANPWLGILEVLAVAGPSRPEVARAWATPALTRDLAPLRRGGLPVLADLRDPVDAPALLGLLRRDTGDRVMGPATTKALFRQGPSQDAATLRILFERALVDLPQGQSGLWIGWPGVRRAAGAGAPDRDLLAWWAALAESAGPLAPESPRPGRRTGRRVHPHDLWATPLVHALFSGREAAASARRAAADAGGATAIASVAQDVAGSDPVLAAIARKSTAPPTEEARAAQRAVAGAQRAALERGGGPTPAEVAATVAALREDPGAEASDRLAGLWDAIPVDPTWRQPLVEAYVALRARDLEARATPRADALLRSGDPLRTDLVLFLARHVKSGALLDLLERWHDDDPASAPWRHRLRREIAYLHGQAARAGPVPAERAAAIAARLTLWAQDPEDPSAPALLGALLDLGPAGERALATGLAGPQRPAFLALLQERPDRYLGAAVVEALVAPVGASTPVEERRRVLEAVFRVAGADAVPTLEAMAHRVGASGREDVAWVLRVVRHR